MVNLQNSKSAIDFTIHVVLIKFNLSKSVFRFRSNISKFNDFFVMYYQLELTNQLNCTTKHSNCSACSSMQAKFAHFKLLHGNLYHKLAGKLSLIGLHSLLSLFQDREPPYFQALKLALTFQRFVTVVILTDLTYQSKINLIFV